MGITIRRCCRKCVMGKRWLALILRQMRGGALPLRGRFRVGTGVFLATHPGWETGNPCPCPPVTPFSLLDRKSVRGERGRVASRREGFYTLREGILGNRDAPVGTGVCLPHQTPSATRNPCPYGAPPHLLESMGQAQSLRVCVGLIS